MKVASEPEALLAVLANPAYHFKRIGLEAGPLSQWLYGVLAEAGLPVICVETRHMRAVLKAQINKTDRNNARDETTRLPCETCERACLSHAASRSLHRIRVTVADIPQCASAVHLPAKPAAA